MSSEEAGSSVPGVPAVQIRCKPKHRPLTASAPGLLRGRTDLRSQCPGWATEALQLRLLAEALTDPGGDTDAFGRPRKLWNALNGFVFVGVSSNEPVPAYNCYPSEPTTALVNELDARKERTIVAFLSEEASDGEA